MKHSIGRYDARSKFASSWYLCAMVAVITPIQVRASLLSFVINHPYDDFTTGGIDIRRMQMNFDTETLRYSIQLTSTVANPFFGDFRVNINLYNIDAGTSQNPAFFQHNVADFNVATPRTTLTMFGLNSRLASWEYL